MSQKKEEEKKGDKEKKEELKEEKKEDVVNVVNLEYAVRCKSILSQLTEEDVEVKGE